MSRVFYTSDLHFGHGKVADIRGFDDADAHDTAVIQNWGMAVREDDIVYVLGDLVGDSRDEQLALDIMRNLPGRKHFIPGNHDSIHPMNRNFHRHMDEFASVFESIAPFMRRKIGGHQALLSHFPYAEMGDGHNRGRPGEGRYNQYRLPNLGLPILHGHTHQAEIGHTTRSAIHLHVGLDSWGLAPVSQEVIAECLGEMLKGQARMLNVEVPQDCW